MYELTAVSTFVQVCFNPQDNTQILVAGEKLFKLFRYSEGSLKQFAFMKADPLTYLCQAWISEDHLVLGSDSGRVQLFEVGDFKNEFVVTAPLPSQEASPLGSKKSMYVCFCVCPHMCIYSCNSISSHPVFCSLVPRPSPAPAIDCLQ